MANERTEELEVGGLHCASCAGELEEGVRRLNGVAAAEANFAAGQIRVRYDADKLSQDDLLAHIERVEYTARQAHKQDEGAPSVWQRREVLFTGIAGLFLAFALLLSFIRLDVPLWTILGRSISTSTLFYLASVLLGAYHFARKGLAAIRAFSLGINFLMSIAVVGAIAIGEYVEAASLAFLFSLAELLEEYSVDRARNSLRELMKLAPSEARVRRDGRELMLPVEQIEIGEITMLKPGERMALDGVVVSGSSSVNQAPVTGESVPIEKKPGDSVFAGTINQEGYLEIKVEKRAKDTTLARIIHLVEEAEAQKAPSERFVDHFAKYYTPSVVAVAIGVATVPPLLFNASFADWVLRSLSLLVISCPCALLISTPVSVVSAITNAARNGVLIKGGVYLEELGQIRALAFDKTGTLTTGQLEVTDVVPLAGYSEDEILRVAAALESKSQHPIAQAVLRRYELDAQGRSLECLCLLATRFESLTGKGIRAQIDGQIYLVGKPEILPQSQAELPAQFIELERQAKTVVLVGTPHRLMGLIAVADEIRPEAKQAVSQLQRLGLEVVMITGDNEGTAQAVAQQLGISHYHAEVLPDGKVTEIQKLVKQHGKVAMVGDGVNDAPALATATVGIAMGAIGTDAALETADVALLSDDLSKLPSLIALSRKARRIIQQNIWASILTKFTLGVGVFPGYVTLVLAVLVGDMGASLAVTANAMRLARVSSQAKGIS
ncbi:MAG: cadmium-translocating P-type ATPase [Candidatus Fraserbacteria bacterium RBG_16_55_9]|uniref:Cadmium-translocating P-type ATPase n=1 Tax=Fraserbacteria sp. (strain RBG_16_55_9) TaxID=1817864 RepID=A0A1F5UY45_FRAXR|nr:MAG: cadmium-translocating P-type ATPase [Candidatus Fraserbacteria bacterium RBG_16_55_9]